MVDALLIEEHEQLPPNPQSLPNGKPPLLLKVTIEVAGQKRVWRSRHEEGYGWSVSGNLICKAIRTIMRFGPMESSS